MDSNEPGHAIPFITFVAKKGFVLTKEAEEFLHSLAESHIGVISVVGKYRTGKSFFINRVLLDTKKNGFNVGPTINPCTKGLWLWSKTLKSNNPEHENMKVILIDTEGFGGMDENSNHDTRIFLFALLLSSFFIYNSAGSIDETALQNLSLIVNLAKEIQVSSGGNNNEDVSQYFPSFLWVVRDFALKLLDLNGDPISSKEYLENALNPQKGISDAVEAKNRIRRLLKHIFRDRDCCTMVRPLENEQELQKLDGMSNDQLRPEFVDQLHDVRNKIFRRVKPKVLNGRSLTGSMLVEITKAYIDGINSGKVPNIENAWTYVCKEESQKAMSEAIRLLDERLGKQASSGPLTSAEMKQFKNQAKEEVYQQFKKKSMGDSEELQELHEELNNQIHQRFSAFKVKNIEKWNHTLMEWISVHSNLEENLKEDKYKSYFEFKVEFDKLHQKFEKEAPTGMNKDQAWKEYSQQIFALAAECISRKAEDLNNGQQRIMTQKLELLEKELTTKKKDYETEKEQLYHQIHQFERERGYARAQENSTKEAIDNLKAQKEKYEKLYNETIERGRDREDKIESEGKAKISDLETKLEKMRSETLSKTVDLEKRNALLEQEMSFVRRENEEIKKKCEALDNEKRELIFSLKQKESYIEECKKELAQAQFGKTQDFNQLKIELERKINDLSNDENKKKEELKQHHDWQMEKFSMENQIQYLTIQLDETKKLHRELLVAIENGRTGNEAEGNYELVQTNKNLSAAMENMEVRCKLFEEKVEKLKKYKRMIRNATALQCSHCSKFISCSIFPQHMKNCISAAQPSPISNPNLIKTITPTTQWQSTGTSSTGIAIEPYSLRVAINQTAVKESPDSKPYTEFMIQVSFNATKWTIAKQYKNFCELHHGLSTQFPNLKLPESALAILGSFSNSNYAPNTKRPDIIEERRKSLEHYLKELIKIDVVRNSAILQKFLVIDQVSKVSNNTTPNQLITQRLNMASFRDESKRMESTLNSRQNVDDELLASDLCSSIGPRQDMTSRLQDTPQSIFSITSPKGKFERTLPPTSPKSFLTGWTEKPLSKENTMPRSRGTSEDTTSKGMRHHLVKDSYRPQHTQLKLNDLTSGRYLNDTPNKLLQDLMASNAADSRTQRSMLENHRGHVSNKSWVSNGQATERILLVQQAEGSSLNKSHTKGSKSIGRIRPSSRNFDDNSQFSGSLNTSAKINHSNTSYNHYQTLTRDQRNY